MKIFVISILAVVTASLSLFGERPLIDFSEDHLVQRVKDSGAEYTEFSTGTHFIRIHTQPVLFRFPGGREIAFQVRRGSFNFNPNTGIITTASLYTELMPAEEAAEVMRIFKQSIGQPTEDVERWLAEVAENKHHQPLAFEQLRTGTGWGHYPAVSLRTKSSMNPTYEWELSFFVQWTPSMYPDGWDEAKAAEHNPRPPAESERISLDPPSGRFYSREEGVRQSFEPGGRFGPDREDEREIEEGEAPEGASKLASPAEADPAEPETEPETHPNKLWIVLLVLGLLLAVVVILMRRR